MRFLATLSCFLLITRAFAYDVEVNGIYYNEKSSLGKTVKVTSSPGSKKYSGLIVIPATINVEGINYKVVEIEDSAFCRCSGVTGVIIGKNVTHVGNSAFNFCTNLEQLVLEDSDDEIFIDCSQEKKLTYNGWDYYDYQHPQFDNCSLKNVYVGRVITRLADNYSGSLGAFYSNKSIENVEFGKNVKKVMDHSFFNCSNILSINLGGVEEVGNSAFRYNKKITTLSLPNTLKSVGEYSFDDLGITELIIPSSLDTIADFGFSDNMQLLRIILKDNPNLKMGRWVFGSTSRDKVLCKEVITYTKKPVGLIEHNNPFGNFASIATLYVPGGCVDIYKAAMGWNEFKMIKENPDDPSDVLVSNIKLDKFYISIEEGKSETLSATVFPENATNKKLIWESSNDNIASVDEGMVRAKSVGTAIVTAKSADGSNITASCTVNVVKGTSYALGDVNADGKIDVADLNILIDIILGNADKDDYNGRAFITDDKNVDVADINAVIDIILGL